MEKVDIAIIGAGIIGSAISYELAKYALSVVVLEKNPVVADETTKGNSGVIHGGFDASSHKSTAPLNVLGNRLWRETIFPILNFPRAQIDSLVIAFNAEEAQHLKMLYKRGLTNGVLAEDMAILDREALLKREPNLNQEVYGALLCTSSWAIDPVTASKAFLEFAQKRGTKLHVNAEVVAIKYQNNEFEISLKNGQKIFAKNIINAAGHYADVMAELAGYPDFTQKTRRGEYRILSRSESGVVNAICFMVPTIHGKGVIVAPMLDGHVLVGPTAEEGVSKADTRLVTLEQFDKIGKIGKKLIPNLRIEKTVMTLAGSRPISVETGDFIIQPAKINPHFINVAGMQSPGLSAAPAIALEVLKLLAQNGTALKIK